MSPDTHVTVVKQALERQESETLSDDVARAAYKAALEAIVVEGVFPGREKLVSRMRNLLGFYEDGTPDRVLTPSHPQTVKKVLENLINKRPRVDQDTFSREDRMRWSRMADAVVNALQEHGYDISAYTKLLTPEAVAAAKAAVDARFGLLENEQTSLPHWADCNLFGALLGKVGKNEARRAGGMTFEQFQKELGFIVEDVVETAEGINNKREGVAIDTQALRDQIQSVADAAWKAASEAMGKTVAKASRVTSSGTHPAR